MSQPLNEQQRRGLDVTPGDRHYRAFIGSPTVYDVLGASQFTMLTMLGLREHHTLLEIGCGSLRAGKLFLAYLLPGRYHGIEPEEWLLNDGIRYEVGQDLIELKQPRFLHDRSFHLSAFQTNFDFILAQSIFSHTSQAQIKRCLSEAKKVMTSTSLFAVTYFPGDTNYEGDEWVYPDVIPYQPTFIKQLIQNEGFAVREVEWNAPNNQRWLLVTLPNFNGPPISLGENLQVVQAERDRYRKRLAELENHPYVRIGMVIKNLLKRRS